MVIPYPNIPEQRAIASFLDRKCAAIDDSIAKHKAIIEKLEEYRKAEITRAVTKGLNPDVKMKDSGIPWIGSYPENWVLTRFKFIASVKSNLVDPTPYLQMPQIGPDIIEKDSGQLISKRTVEEAGVVSGNHLFHAGQILYSKVRPALNKVVMAPYDGLCSADMYPIETIESTKYVLYMMLSNMFLKQADIISEIRVKMPKINQDEIGDIRIVLPKRDEQDAMVKLLDDVCNKVADAIFRHNQLIAKLKEYKNSLIYNAVTGKIDCREET